jgi:hypothetical protein
MARFRAALEALSRILVSLYGLAALANVDERDLTQEFSRDCWKRITWPPQRSGADSALPAIWPSSTFWR